MNNWDIIQTNEKLTKSEYKQLYYSLFREETCNIKWKEPEIFEYIDYIRLKLKYLSKSGKNIFPWCNKQFHYARFLVMPFEDQQKQKRIYLTLGLPILKESPEGRLEISGRMGGNIHLVYNKVWNNINVEKIKSFNYYEDISNYIYLKCINLDIISSGEIAQHVYNYFFRQYANFESLRIMNIINYYGTNNNVNNYILPTYRELKIENRLQKQAGIIDVINRLLDDSYGITDYKTGSPKYYFDHYDKKGNILDANKWEKKSIAIEIAEYYSLLQDGAYKVINKNEMIPFEHINISHGRLLYLRDWEQTYKYIPITIPFILETQEIDGDIIECINIGKFRRRITQYCPFYCKYYPLCKKSFDFKKKFQGLSKDIDKAFAYFTL